MIRVCIAVLLILELLGIQMPGFRLFGWQEDAFVLEAVTERDGSGVKEYWARSRDGSTGRLADSFDPDDAEVYTAAFDCFSCRLEDERVVNTLVSTSLTDGAGETVRADETTERLLRTLAGETGHAILEVRIFVDGGTYYAAVKENVNWSDPCLLYLWERETDSLQFVFRWDGVTVVGIRQP